MAKLCGHRRSARNDRGFTLIEASIVLLIVGILAVPILKQIDHHYRVKALDDTVQRQGVVYKAIEEYFYVFKAYPCPADPNLSPDDADYGESVACRPGGWLPDGSNGNKVSIGAVPFKDLKIDVSATLDGWENKIIYAVSTDLTTNLDPVTGKPIPVDPDDAELRLRGFNFTQPGGPGTPLNWMFVDYGNSFPPPSPGPAKRAHLILISTGPKGAGGYTADGVLIEPCPSGGNKTADTDNCDWDRDFTISIYSKNFAHPSAHIQSTVEDKDYFDDWTMHRYELPSRIWAYSQDPEDIYTQIPLIGVGTNDPQVELDIAGNLKTSSGKAKTLGFCETDVGTADCFAASLIGGSEEDMDCSAGAGINLALTGIGDSEKKCNVSYATGVSFSCGPGEFITGIDAGGNPICVTPPP